MQAVRLQVYQRSQVKDIRLVNRDGSVICSAYSETLEFDSGWAERSDMLRSQDKGATWKLVEGAPGTAALMGAEKLADGALVLAGNAGTVLVSRDNGVTFTRIPAGTTRAFAKALALDGNNILLLGETGARILALPAANTNSAGAK